MMKTIAPIQMLITEQYCWRTCLDFQSIQDSSFRGQKCGVKYPIPNIQQEREGNALNQLSMSGNQMLKLCHTPD